MFFPATELAALLETIQRPGTFFVSGAVELLAPALDVAGVGQIALPLLPAQARQLIDIAETAPFGRGEHTITDPAVRRCWQIGPDKVSLGGRHWPRTLDAILACVAKGLGVSDPITAEFYKLLVYDKGSFFVGHRDTEKVPGMFATLVVVLPSSFAGGELVVRHKDSEVRLDLHCADGAEAAFAAFYADCVHEVLPVTDGCRLALAYNLVRAEGPIPEPPDYAIEQGRITSLLRAWREAKSRPDDATPEKLVMLLEHAYTPAELGFRALKGADAAIAGALAVAARQAGCDLHLALLTIEESGAAEYSEQYGAQRGRWRDQDDEFEAGEVFDRSMLLSDWRALDGETFVLGEIPALDEEFSQPDAHEELAPDEEHFHEATGNEGASFERTYRRAALVLWPSDRTFAVLCQAGLAVTLPTLEALIARLTENGRQGSEDHQASLRHEACNLAGHMLEQWPRQAGHGRCDDSASDVTRMLTQLTSLRSQLLIDRFTTEVIAAGGYEKRDNEALINALDSLPPTRRVELVEGIVSGTMSNALGACANLLARAAAAWPASGACSLGSAATQLIGALPSDLARTAPPTPWQDLPKVEPGLVVDLLNGLGLIDQGLAARAMDHFLSWPETYDLDAILVPAARHLMGADTVKAPGAVERLRASCLAHLRARIAEPLAPPADWRRAKVLPCRCVRCKELARFLADPGLHLWTLKAAEADRRHVEDTIRRAMCDVDTITERRGRPYRLVCTKNQASYERSAKQRLRDLEDVKRLADQ